MFHAQQQGLWHFKSQSRQVVIKVGAGSALPHENLSPSAS